MARKTDPPTPPAPDRGDATRQKLLLAAIDVFGRLGFDGATTRALADAAGVNLQAIPYHFSGKEGLYLAAADHIAGRIGERLADERRRLTARLAAEQAGESIAPEEARALLRSLFHAVAELLMSPELESWARFIIREQMHPTEAFSRIYQGGMGPLMEAARILVGRLLGEEPGDERVGMRTMGLLGSVLFFRTARAAAQRFMAWPTVGRREIDMVKALADELVAALQPGGGP